MKRVLGNAWVQVVIFTVAYVALAWWWKPLGQFSMGLVLLAAPYAGALVLPLQRIASDLRHDMRAAVWEPEHGSYYAYHGARIHVVEDEGRCRWVCLDDARKVCGVGGTDGSLQRRFTDRFARVGTPLQSYLRDDALVEALAKATDDRALRFRTWVERTVVKPGQNVRAGLPAQRPEEPDDD